MSCDRKNTTIKEEEAKIIIILDHRLEGVMRKDPDAHPAKVKKMVRGVVPDVVFSLLANHQESQKNEISRLLASVFVDRPNPSQTGKNLHPCRIRIRRCGDLTSTVSVIRRCLLMAAAADRSLIPVWPNQ